MAPETGENTWSHETIATVLSDHPVTVGILFGSRARGDADAGSDVDVAVTFESLEPGDDGYNDALFGLSAALATELGTDDVDVVDLQTTSPTLARVIFEEGIVLVGADRDVEATRESVLAGSEDASPGERFDDVVASIDDHLA